MKAKASICISEDETLIESLEIARDRIQIMIDKGMDNTKKLQGLVDRANQRITEVKTGLKPALRPDADAKYYAEVVIDLDEIAEPMIAIQMYIMKMFQNDTHDTSDISYYGGTKKLT